jgi:hypothetical protein
MSRTSVRHDRSRRFSPGASHRPHPPAPHPPAGPPLLRVAAVSRGCLGVAAGQQPAASPAGRAAGDWLPGAVPGADPDRSVRGVVDSGGTVGATPLQRRLVPGRQPPRSRSEGQIPAPQARAGPRPLLPRHIPPGWGPGAVAGRQGSARAVGAAGPSPALPGCGRAGGHAAGRRWAAVAGGHRRRPRPAPRPGPGQGGRGGPRDHPPLRGRDPGRRAAGVGASHPRRELPAPCGSAGQAGQGRKTRAQAGTARVTALAAASGAAAAGGVAQSSPCPPGPARGRQAGCRLRRPATGRHPRRGRPNGITKQDAGRVQNWRLRQWRRTHLLQALRDKAELAGIVVRLVDERGTSSTCPACHQRVPKPPGRRFRCPHCTFQGHRDLVGAANIAATAGGGPTSAGVPTLVEHRRAGVVPARRDRRRHLHDQRRRRSCLASGHPQDDPVSSGCRSPRVPDLAPGEDQAASSTRANAA